MFAVHRAVRGGKRDFVAMLRHLDAPSPGRHFHSSRCRASLMLLFVYNVLMSKLITIIYKQPPHPSDATA